MKTLSLVMIVGKEEEFLKESLESSVPHVDEIVIVFDAEKTNDETRKIVDDMQEKHFYKQWCIQNRKWDCGTKQKQYAFSLATKDWVLFLDSDEILGDNAHLLKLLIEKVDKHKFKTINLRSHHFIYSLGQEDATVEKHYHACRLIENDKKLFSFEGINHAILKCNKPGVKGCTEEEIRIYHMGYVKHLHKIMQKHHKDMKIQQIHNVDFLKSWKDSHVFGNYPVKPVNLADLPKTVLNKFNVDKDEFYFHNRANLEMKHFEETEIWKWHFKPISVLMCGAGAGQRVYAMKKLGVSTHGFDISKFIVNKNAFNLPKHEYYVDDITKLDNTPIDFFDLVVAYDILEHLTHDQLKEALDKMYKKGSAHFLFSIPFLGDPNLDADPTHIIKETKGWWMQMLQASGFEICVTPKHFPFNEQIIVATKKEESK